MNVEVLGAHCLESQTTRLTCLLVDGILALDAGGLTSGLSLTAQGNLRGILLTHQHLDHVKDIGLIGYHNTLLIGMGTGETKNVYSTAETLDNILNDLLNGRTFPNFTHSPLGGKAPLRFCPLEPYTPQPIEGYQVIAIPVKHSVSTVGYGITSPEGKTLFFTGDTGPHISHCWDYVSPDLLITELTGPNKFTERLLEVGHLSPQLLRQELIEFRQIKGYIPRTVLVHHPPELEQQLSQEIEQVARELGADITLGQEGMNFAI